MPRFEAFAGHRYDPALAPIGRVIAPPYDVVDEQERADLASRSPYNAIHVELPEPEGALDRYEHAAALFADWQDKGALKKDGACLYIYKMHFTDEFGNARSTTGVIGALGVDVAGGSEVLPHEQTMPKPKGDRLDLLRACRANLSPIWGLSLSDGLAEACLRAVASSSVALEARDDGVVHEIVAVSDPSAIAEIRGLVESTPIVIADGHHRYETARFYQEEQREQNGNEPGDHDLVMALVVELTEDELFVQGIHRLISELPDDLDLHGALEPFFEISEGPADAEKITATMLETGSLALVEKNAVHLLRPRPSLDAASPADLDSSRLDVALDALPKHELIYQHGVNHVFAAVREGRAQAGILLRPASVAQIADTAHSGKRMPPKTTFFNPKPRTGMVFRALSPSESARSPRH